MGARAGRHGARSYNLLTCGRGSWRKYLDKTRRKTARNFAINEQLEDVMECFLCGRPRCLANLCDHCAKQIDRDIEDAVRIALRPETLGDDGERPCTHDPEDGR